MDEPGISTFSVRAVLQEADARGLAGDALLARNALSREQVSDPDGWVPLRRYAGLYRDAVAACGDPGGYWVGVGGRALVHAARVTGHAAAASSTVREALETWARLSGLIVDSARYHVESTPAADRFFGTWPAAHATLFADIQVSAVLAFRHFVAYVAGPVTPIEAFLARPAPASTAAVDAAFGAPVRWGAEWPRLDFPPGTFERAVHLADPKLRSVLVEAAQRRLEMRSAARTSDRVRAAILDLGFDRSANVAAVAGALGTTPRTLQRWLQDESLTYSQVRGEALSAAAIEMFRGEGSAVADVAFRLGFSSRDAFHRAIRRWTGKTPGELRSGIHSR
ncbi:MAG: AraC family transcriptional regulator ligand-binding domain-containing protein [Anaeromyxobacteraceae bacterium]